MLRGVLAFVCSTKMIPMIKGALAFTIAIGLVMLHGFTALIPFPPAMASMTIVTLVRECDTVGVPTSC